MSEVAEQYNLPIEVVEAIYKSQNKFIYEKMSDRTKTYNIHIGGLGKFYSEKDRTTPAPRYAIKTSSDN